MSALLEGIKLAQMAKQAKPLAPAKMPKPDMQMEEGEEVEEDWEGIKRTAKKVGAGAVMGAALMGAGNAHAGAEDYMSGPALDAYRAQTQLRHHEITSQQFNAMMDKLNKENPGSNFGHIQQLASR